jgi:hypothetical protein
MAPACKDTFHSQKVTLSGLGASARTRGPIVRSPGHTARPTLSAVEGFQQSAPEGTKFVRSAQGLFGNPLLPQWTVRTAADGGPPPETDHPRRRPPVTMPDSRPDAVPLLRCISYAPRRLHRSGDRPEGDHPERRQMPEQTQSRLGPPRSGYDARACASGPPHGVRTAPVFLRQLPPRSLPDSEPFSPRHFSPLRSNGDPRRLGPPSRSVAFRSGN